MQNKKYQKGVEDIINKMFSIAGYEITFKDIENRTDFWFNQYTMTTSQYDEWQSWGEKYLHKKLKLSTKQAKGEIAMMGLQFGLRTDDLAELRQNKIDELLKE